MIDKDFERWQKMSLMEQMANIGSEVYRASSWRVKNNHDYSQKAFERALELIDMTLRCNLRTSALREVARAREALCEAFLEDGVDFEQDFMSFNKYFHHFALGLKR